MNYAQALLSLALFISNVFCWVQSKVAEQRCNDCPDSFQMCLFGLNPFSRHGPYEQIPDLVSVLYGGTIAVVGSCFAG